MSRKINVKDTEVAIVTVISVFEKDYISLTDIAKYKKLSQVLILSVIG
jgi:hypothetical protein